jgi:predicted Fe-Mo cluster-binding NifX family protein
MYFYSKTKTAERFDEIVDKAVGFEKPGVDVVKSGVAGGPPAEPHPQAENNSKEVAMKFAIPTYQGKLCAHFGHCEAFALIDTDSEGKVVNENYVTPPPHEPGLLPPWLAQQGVNCIIAGGMGSRAQQLFAQQGVRVVTGAQGEDPREVVEQYLKGTLQTGANTCDH